MEIIRSLNRSWIDDTHFSLYRPIHPKGKVRGKCPREKCTDTLDRVNKTSKFLQSKDVDILGAMDLLESLKAYLDEIRDKFGEYELKTRDRCPDSDYSFANKQIYDSPEEEVIQHKSDKFKVETSLPVMYFPFLWPKKACRTLFVDWKSVFLFLVN